MNCEREIAIIGPINSRGGREIESAFIASVLKKHYKVSIYSTELIDKENDLYSVDSSLKIFKRHKTLNRLKRFIGLSSNYEKLYFKSLNSASVKSLEKAILNVDLVFIIAQLTSNYTKEIILLAQRFKKKIIFRTTGTIPSYFNLNHIDFDYLKHVNLFINHSENNSFAFKQNKELNYIVIDQCVFEEENILGQQKEISSRINKFYCVSRLDDNKDVMTIIKAFNDLMDYSNLELHIIGDGEQIENLKSNSKNKNISFYGHLKYHDMINMIAKFDCLIISSKEEAGPYNALEAMLLGKPIISTKVGAMMERFDQEKDMWFKQGDYKNLSQKIIEFSNYDISKLKNIQKRYTSMYEANHSKRMVSTAYLEAVNLYLT